MRIGNLTIRRSEKQKPILGLTQDEHGGWYDDEWIEPYMHEHHYGFRTKQRKTKTKIFGALINKEELRKNAAEFIRDIRKDEQGYEEIPPLRKDDQDFLELFIDYAEEWFQKIIRENELETLQNFFDYFTVSAQSMCEQDVTLDSHGNLDFTDVHVYDNTISLFITVDGTTFEHEIEDINDECSAILEFARAWEEAGKPKVEDRSMFFMDDDAIFTKGEK